MLVIFIGAPGSGKSTLAKNLCENLPNRQIISTGDFARSLRSDEYQNDAEYGYLQEQFNEESLQQQDRGESGRRVSDEIMIAYLSLKLKSLERGQALLLDGFPRTEAQAGALLSTTKSLKIIHCTITKEIAKERYLARDRKDANPAAFERRFNEYIDLEKSILNPFQAESIPLLSIDCSKSIEGNMALLEDYIPDTAK